jgi:hypothetical protein
MRCGSSERGWRLQQMRESVEMRSRETDAASSVRAEEKVRREGDACGHHTFTSELLAGAL